MVSEQDSSRPADRSMPARLRIKAPSHGRWGPTGDCWAIACDRRHRHPSSLARA